MIGRLFKFITSKFRIIFNVSNGYVKNVPVDQDPTLNKKVADAKQRIFSDQLAKQRLGLSEAHLNLSERSLNDRELKDKDKKTLTNPDGTPVVSDWGTLTAPDKIQEIKNPATGDPIKYVDATNWTLPELRHMTGSKYSATHGDVGGAKPYQVGDKKIFYVNPDGTLTGRTVKTYTSTDGKTQETKDIPTILRKSDADAAQINAIPKSKLKMAPDEAPKPTMIQRATKYIKSKFKGTKNDLTAE